MAQALYHDGKKMPYMAGKSYNTTIGGVATTTNGYRKVYYNDNSYLLTTFTKYTQSNYSSYSENTATKSRYSESTYGTKMSTTNTSYSYPRSYYTTYNSITGYGTQRQGVYVSSVAQNNLTTNGNTNSANSPYYVYKTAQAITGYGTASKFSTSLCKTVHDTNKITGYDSVYRYEGTYNTCSSAISRNSVSLSFAYSIKKLSLPFGISGDTGYDGDYISSYTFTINNTAYFSATRTISIWGNNSISGNLVFTVANKSFPLKLYKYGNTAIQFANGYVLISSTLDPRYSYSESTLKSGTVLNYNTREMSTNTLYNYNKTSSQATTTATLTVSAVSRSHYTTNAKTTATYSAKKANYVSSQYFTQAGTSITKANTNTADNYYAYGNLSTKYYDVATSTYAGSQAFESNGAYASKATGSNNATFYRYSSELTYTSGAFSGYVSSTLYDERKSPRITTNNTNSTLATFNRFSSSTY